LQAIASASRARSRNTARPSALARSRDAALVAVDGLEEQAFGAPAEAVVEVRAEAAGDVATLVRVLDLDNLRAEVGQGLCAERTGTVLLDREHTQTVEWPHGKRSAMPDDDA